MQLTQKKVFHISIHNFMITIIILTSKYMKAVTLSACTHDSIGEKEFGYVYFHRQNPGAVSDNVF